MQRYQRLLQQCQQLYTQWLTSGGFNASGMFMEGHYCMRSCESERQE